VKSFHVICGLPRSGSTLLCNVLNQNPRFFASSTSILPQTLAQLSALWSNSPEIKADLARDAKGTEKRLNDAVKALIGAWYKGRGVVFDKSRGWAHNALPLKKLYPEARIIVTVRDLRSIFASIEKHHAANPLLDHAANPQEKEIYTRADQMFSPQGMIGLTVGGVMDLMRRKPPGLFVVQYETFAENPDMIMDRLYAEIGEPRCEHDFAKVENTATDLDALYLNKFPHEGSGRVEAVDRDEWRRHVPQDVAGAIMQTHAGFNQAFGYN